MDSYRHIIDAFGGYAEFAEAIGISAGTASSLRTRNSLPARYWHQTVDAANRRGVAGVTLTRLAELAAGIVPTPELPPQVQRVIANPAALAAIFDKLGGHTFIAEGSGIPVTDLEAMQAQGRVWSQHRAALIGFAREPGGHDLDTDRLTLRPLGKDSPSWRAA